MEHSAMNPRDGPRDGQDLSDETSDQGVDAKAEPGWRGLVWTEQRRLQHDRHDQQEDEEQSEDEDTDSQDETCSQLVAKQPCVVCWKSVEELPQGKYVNLSCGGTYCVDCLRVAFELSLRCESNFPLLCGCKQRIRFEKIHHLLGQELLDRYDAVSREWTSVHQTYCAKCFQYLDSQKFHEDQRYSICTGCDTWTCRDCKASKATHGSGCPRNLDQERLMMLSRVMKWKQCSNCGSLIEKTEGCTDMTCICGHKFCYICGRSACVRLECVVGQSNRRFGLQQGVFEPEDGPTCEHAAFRYSPSGGLCRGACGHTLPLFLNECMNCGMRFCTHCVIARSFVPQERNDENLAREIVEQELVPAVQMNHSMAQPGGPSVNQSLS